MITQNQLEPVFQSALGRAPTDYEVKTFSTASPQTLANLKNTYGKLNTSNSIVDYLTSIGQDPSLQSRTALGQKYGINNIGTSEGNIALLNALKSGKQPSVTGALPPPPTGTDITQTTTTTQNPPVGGSITTASTPNLLIPNLPADATVYRDNGNGSYDAVENGTGRVVGNSTQIPNGQYIVPNDKATAPGNDVNGTPVTTPTTDTTTKVSTDPSDPLSNPDIVAKKDAYVAAQKQVQSIDSQIANLRDIMTQALNEKIKQAAVGGGVENRAQMANEVAFENQGIQAQINGLLSQRAQYANAQSLAGKDYQDATANFYKSANLGLAETKVANQEQQFAAKYEQAGYKAIKTNITDSAGNVLGQSITTWVNPANKSLGVTSDGTNVALSTKDNVTTATPIGNNSLPTVDKKDTPPANVSLANGFTPTQVYQSLISGPDKTVKGAPGVKISQEDLYNWAVDSIMGTQTAPGQRPSASGGLNALIQSKATEIKKAYGLNEVDVNIAKSEFKNLTSTNAAILQRASLTNISANQALDNLDLVIKTSANVPRTGAKLVNNYQQWLSGNFTPAGPLAALETAIYTYGREYAKVTSGSSASISGLTDSAQAEVNKLLNAAQSPEVLASVTDIMKKDMQNVIKENQKGVDAYPDAVQKLYGFLGSNGGQTQSSNVNNDDLDYSLQQIGVKKGGDGYVSPDDYKKITAEWVKGGNDASTVDSVFGILKNPNNPNY